MLFLRVSCHVRHAGRYIMLVLYSVIGVIVTLYYVGVIFCG